MLGGIVHLSLSHSLYELCSQTHMLITTDLWIVVVVGGDLLFLSPSPSLSELCSQTHIPVSLRIMSTDKCTENYDVVGLLVH